MQCIFYQSHPVLPKDFMANGAGKKTASGLAVALPTCNLAFNEGRLFQL
jgi:hypothetical protein